MSKYVEFPLEGGGTIIVESSDEPARSPSGFLRSGEGTSDNAAKAAATFDASVEGVRKSADLLVSKLRQLSAPPDEMEVSFSLKASSEVGSLVVGRSGPDSNFNVTLRWRTEEAGKDKDKDKDKSHAERERKAADEHYQNRKRRTLPPEAPAAEAEPDDDDDEPDI